MKTKGNTFFTAIGQLIKSLWKLFLLLVYASAKTMETLAGFLSKVTEKMLN